MIRNLLFMLTEATWLLAPLLLLEAALPGGSVAAAILLYPLGYGAARFLPIRDDRLWVEFAVAAGLAAALLVAAAVAAGTVGTGDHPAERFVMAALVGVLAWIRGWLLARRSPDATIFALSFQFGLIVLAAMLPFADRYGVPVGTQLMLAVALVLFGLGGLWHARAGGTGGPVRGSPGTALLGLAAVFVIGAFIWVLFDRSALEAGLAVLQWFGHQIMRLIAYLVGLLPKPAPVTGELPAQPMRPLAPRDGALPNLPRQPPPFLGQVALALIACGVVATVVLALYRFLRSLAGARRAGRTRGLAYGRARGSVLDGLRAFLRRIGTRLSDAVARRVERWHESRREGSVRGRYRRLLAKLAGRGWPRRASETPEEYRRRLGPEWPEAVPHLDELTEAFVAARYGGREPDPARVEALWRRLRSGLGSLRRVHD